MEVGTPTGVHPVAIGVPCMRASASASREFGSGSPSGRCRFVSDAPAASGAGSGPPVLGSSSAVPAAEWNDCPSSDHSSRWGEPTVAAVPDAAIPAIPSVWPRGNLGLRGHPRRTIGLLPPARLVGTYASSEGCAAPYRCHKASPFSRRASRCASRSGHASLGTAEFHRCIWPGIPFSSNHLRLRRVISSGPLDCDADSLRPVPSELSGRLVSRRGWREATVVLAPSRRVPS